MLSEKIIAMLVLAGVLTFWTTFFEPMYINMIEARGSPVGLGETFLGYLIPASASLIITWLLVRRLKNRD